MSERDLIAALGELLPAGLILVEEGLRLRHANRRAHELVKEADGLSLGAGVVQAEPLVQQAIQRVLQGQAAEQSVRIRRPERPPLGLSILPLPGVPALVALLLHAPESEHELSDHYLRQVYRLSPAETALAKFLARGATLKEAAEFSGLKVETVRSQLKSIFSKTGTRRQADLVRLLLGSARPAPPALWALRAPATPSEG